MYEKRNKGKSKVKTRERRNERYLEMRGRTEGREYSKKIKICTAQQKSIRHTFHI
jgi:hypothetical protein